MVKFLAGRLIQFPIILAVIYVITFLLAWVAPGSPFQRTERPLAPQVQEQLKRQFHAESWHGFLLYYPPQMLKGNFGPSFNYPGRSVSQILSDGLPVSIALGGLAMSIAITIGVFIGTLAAVFRGRALDWVSLTVALLGVSVPSFVAAAVLRGVFAYHWTIFPLGRWPSGIETRLIGPLGHQFWDTLHASGFTSALSAWAGSFPQYLYAALLPAIALSLLPMAYITRLTRVSMIDVLGSDYVRTARAKGLSRPRVIFKHCLRNAILPVLSYIGPAAAATLVGSFVVETVFQIPGLGQFFVNSVQSRDQTLILGTVMTYSVLLLGLNLLVDVAYGWVDPRISVGGG